MRRLRRLRVARFSLALLALLLTIPVALTWRQVRQERLNHDLIAAIKRTNVTAVASLLRQGADPYSPVFAETIPSRSWWQLLLDHLHGQHPHPIQVETAIQLAVPSPFSFEQQALSEPVRRSIHNASDLLACYGQFQNDRMRIIELLVGKGVSPDTKTVEGMPLLYAATLSECPHTVQFLLEHGANPNATTQVGWTPLMCAVYNGNSQLVKLLLDHGANPNFKDGEGFTLLQLAGHTDIIHLLKQAGARE